MGELARQPGCPELPATPIELLTPRPYENDVIGKWFYTIGGAGVGVASAIARNAFLQRPAWAGIQVHILLAGILGYGMKKVHQLFVNSDAETNEVLKHYVCLHPEDFPPFERKRYRDVYVPFVPAR